MPLMLGALALTGYVSLSAGWGYDDPYITFRYAGNLLGGHGLVYNAGERTLSTTTPLFAILLAGLGRIWPDLPALGRGLSLASLLAGSAIVALWPRGEGVQNEGAGLLAGLLLSLSPPLLSTTGSEMCLYVGLVLGGLLAYGRSRWLVAAGLLALAAMLRPDGLIAGVVVGMLHLIRRRPLPWRAVLLYAALVAAWYAGLWLYYGWPLPVTLLAKQQQARMEGGAGFLSGFLALVRQYSRQPAYWAGAALALVGARRVAAARGARHWLPLMGWTALTIAGYTAVGVSRYFWYYALMAPAAAVLVAEGTADLIRGLGRVRLPRWTRQGLAALLLAGLTAPLVSGLAPMAWRSDPRLGPYRRAGEWLAAHTPPEASVGALEVGIIGYYAERPMVDFAGLIQPQIARRLAAAGTYQGSAEWAIRTYRPDYVVLYPEAFPGLVAGQEFRSAYVPTRTFASQESWWLTVYRRGEDR